MTIEERDRLRARRVLHYTDKSARESAKVAERERRNLVMRNETGVLSASVKDTSWQGVPYGIPANKYPNRDRKPRHREQPIPQPDRAPIEQVLVQPPAEPILFASRASDARGRTEGNVPQYGIRPWKLHELPDVVTAGVPDRS